MEPLLVNEKLVSFFKFWAKDNLQNGMRCSNELFRQVRTFGVDQRPKAYSLGWALAERGIRVVTTWSLHGYALWICMRSTSPSQTAVAETQASPKNFVSSTTSRFSAKTAHNSLKGNALQERVLVSAF